MSTRRYVTGFARAVLWGALGLVAVNGLINIFETPAPAAGSRERAAETFPDRRAEAFAVGFARAYLTFVPGKQDWVEPSLKPYITTTLAEGGLRVPTEGKPQTVDQVVVVDSQSVGPRQGVVTVMAVVSHKVVRVRYLNVPVATDGRGGLVVYDYPSLVAGPARVEVEIERGVDPGGDRIDALEALFEAFFPVYLGGSGDLDRFAPPGAHLRRLPEPYRLDNVHSVVPVAGQPNVVLVEVFVTHEATGAQMALRFRARVVHDGRWYVAGIS